MRTVNPGDHPPTTVGEPAAVGLIFASALIVLGALHMLYSAIV